jgi:transposase-like protein
MRAENGLPETLQEAVVFFANEDNAFEFLMSERWPNGLVSCPRCNSEKVGLIKTRRMWRCNGCKKQFSLKIGTVMEDSPIGLDKWLCGFWLIVNAKNGISSYEIHRSLGVTQKTAWFLLHRIRLAMQNGGLVSFKNQVEADETFIGAKARYMHKDRRHKEGNPGNEKTPILGILERTEGDKASRVTLRVTRTRRKPELQAIVREIVEKGSNIYTDNLRSYDGLEDAYTHQIVDHLESYAQGQVHTNGLENFWSLFKRMIHGTYVNVEPFHLFRYCDEQAFRFNERKDNDQGRFLTAIRGMFGKGLRYKKLIGQEDGGSLPPPSTATWQTA